MKLSTQARFMLNKAIINRAGTTPPKPQKIKKFLLFDVNLWTGKGGKWFQVHEINAEGETKQC